MRPEPGTTQYMRNALFLNTGTGRMLEAAQMAGLAASDWTWADKNYGVKGTPDTALVDQQGRIMFKPHVHDAETRGVMEREVEALLNRGTDR